MDNFNSPIPPQNQPQKINWRQFGKHWIVVFILAIAAALVIWGMLQLGPWLKGLQDQRAAESLRSQMEIKYRQDKYGGNTPEETFDLFVGALEKNDIALASRFFVLEKQEQWGKTLNEYKKSSLLVNFVQELKNAEAKWIKIQTGDSNKAEFNYSIVIEKDTVMNFNGQQVPVKAGKYTGSVSLQRYPSGNWKIYDI